MFNLWTLARHARFSSVHDSRGSDYLLSLPCTMCTLTLTSTWLNLLQVYRMAADDIGCSLAEAAEAKPYEAYLAQAQATPRSLHVVSCA